jgi:EAL domain-containing protein (putative c-di-GMP-specific phosphodiesterase class I)
LTLFCQPIAELSTPDAYPIAEVLVRLREEEEANLPPGEFLPVFEHFNMMTDLDRWVIKNVARVLARARSASAHSASINISAQSLRDGELAAFVQRTIDEYGLPPGALCLEIDEVDMLERNDAAAAFSAAARAAGCSVAVDGFGQRAVSFAPLEAMQVEFIKVDGCITRNLLKHETALKKMQAIVDAAKAIGARVIAEFVEDNDVLECLREIGVGYAQGFGVAQPAPLESVFHKA